MKSNEEDSIGEAKADKGMLDDSNSEETVN